MLILMFLSVGAVISTAVFLRTENDFIEMVSFAFMASSSIFLFVALILVPVAYYETHSEIHQFVSVQETAETMRNSPTMENAAFQLKIAEMNQWLASTKYWNTTMFKLWIPNEVDKLTPIK